MKQASIPLLLSFTLSYGCTTYTPTVTSLKKEVQTVQEVPIEPVKAPIFEENSLQESEIIKLNPLQIQNIPEDYQEAVLWYKNAAEQGSLFAQAKLAMMYEQGREVAKNYQKALFWYQKAADQGSLIAQTKMGEIYERGNGVEKNAQQALFWYQQAAEDDYPDAQYRMGLLSLFGNDGITQNSEEAVGWFKAAANQGHAKAQFALAMQYYRGDGVDFNLGRAKNLSNLACKQKYKKACSFLKSHSEESKRKRYDEYMAAYNNLITCRKDVKKRKSCGTENDVYDEEMYRMQSLQMFDPVLLKEIFPANTPMTFYKRNY